MKFLKKLKVTDYVIIVLALILVGVAGFALTKKDGFSNLPVEKEVPIQFDVFFRGITLTTQIPPFKPGDDAFITIRNVPYTKLKIKDIMGRPRMTVIPASTKEGYAIVEDVNTPYLFDFAIKLEDKAKKTPDGYVAGGNKIKMGIPVVIEGPNYRYSGTVSNIVEVEEQKEEIPPEEFRSSLGNAIQNEILGK